MAERAPVSPHRRPLHLFLQPSTLPLHTLIRRPSPPFGQVDIPRGAEIRYNPASSNLPPPTLTALNALATIGADEPAGTAGGAGDAHEAEESGGGWRARRMVESMTPPALGMHTLLKPFASILLCSPSLAFARLRSSSLAFARLSTPSLAFSRLFSPSLAFARLLSPCSPSLTFARLFSPSLRSGDALEA